MITFSVKKNSFSHLSFHTENNNIIVNDYGFSRLKKNTFSKDDINSTKQRKKIKNAKIISKKCMIFLDTEDIIMNQIKHIDEISFIDLVQWQNELMFGKEKIDYFNDYHYKACTDKNILSIYIKKTKEMSYLKNFSDSGMNLKVLSVGLFSAEYLAREFFGAKDQKKYIVWAVGGDTDEMIVIKDGLFKSIIKFQRINKTIIPISYVGSEKYAKDCFDKIKSSFPKNLKSMDIVDKIYMYQKSPNTDMKKILKKNKGFATILNPLLKVDFPKKQKIDQIESSYLSEMGYIFKTINND